MIDGKPFKAGISDLQVNTEVKTQPPIASRTPIEVFDHTAALQKAISELKRESFVDNDGMQHVANKFTAKNGEEIEVVFHGRNEKPYDSERYKNESNAIFVEKSPLPYLQLVKRLGIEVPGLDLDKSIEVLSHTKEIPLALWVILDPIIAYNYQIKRRKAFLPGTDFGEALMIKALQGNKAASLALSDKLVELSHSIGQADEEKAIRLLEEEIHNKNEEEPFDTSKLAVVHARSYPVEEDSSRYVWNTFDVTGRVVPRNTFHSTLNHVVESHPLGNWDDSNTIVIDGYQEFCGLNGDPILLTPQDTVFENNPGQPVKFSDKSTIIHPGNFEEEGLISEINPGELVYKTNLTNDDIQVLQGSGLISETQIYQVLSNALNNLKTEEAEKPLGGFRIDTSQMISDMGKMGVEGCIREFCNSSDIQIDKFLDTGVIGQLKQVLAESSRSYAIKKILSERYGAKYMPASPNEGWDAYKFEKEAACLRKLGAQKGIENRKLAKDLNAEQIKGLFAGVFGARGLLPLLEAGKISIREFTDKYKESLKPLLPGASLKSLRMLYVMGMI